MKRLRAFVDRILEPFFNRYLEKRLGEQLRPGGMLRPSTPALSPAQTEAICRA